MSELRALVAANFTKVAKEEKGGIGWGKAALLAGVGAGAALGGRHLLKGLGKKVTPKITAAKKPLAPPPPSKVKVKEPLQLTYTPPAKAKTVGIKPAHGGGGYTLKKKAAVNFAKTAGVKRMARKKGLSRGGRPTDDVEKKAAAKAPTNAVMMARLLVGAAEAVAKAARKSAKYRGFKPSPKTFPQRWRGSRYMERLRRK